MTALADRAHRSPKIYGDYYSVASGAAIRELERTAVGIDWGGNGYTTVEQVDELIDCLHLRPGSSLLDIGAGAGWPAVYLAARSGCEVVASDLALSGMQAAQTRAGDKGVDATSFVVSSAASLPFADGSFDAVSHSDLLC